MDFAPDELSFVLEATGSVDRDDEGSLHETLTITKKIKADEITWAHGNPISVFREGKDLYEKEHTYQCYLTFTKHRWRKRQIRTATRNSRYRSGEFRQETITGYRRRRCCGIRLCR